MIRIRIESVEGPLMADASAVHAAATLLARGGVMGFLPENVDTRVLNVGLLDGVFKCLAVQDVAVGLLVHGPWTSVTLGHALDQALEQSEHSPMPDGEWPNLVQTLGEAQLAELLDISASSLRRYANGTRATPTEVASRLHVLALVIADLMGGYNDFGIQRWFTRPRTQLDGRSPVQLLGKGWDPDGPEALRLRGLAAGLVGAGAA